MQYGELYHKNYYREVKDKNRVYYEFYHLDGTENVPEDYKEISFVCLRPDGSLELPSTLGIVCRKIAQKLDGFEGFHFHQLRHKLEFDLPIFLKSHVELLFHLPRYALLTLTFHCALLISKHWKFTHYMITGDHILSEIIM